MFAGIGIIVLVCIFQVYHQNSIIHQTLLTSVESLTLIPKNIISHLSNSLRNQKNSKLKYFKDQEAEIEVLSDQEEKVINKQEQYILKTFSSDFTSGGQNINLITLSFFNILMFALLVPPLIFYYESIQISEMIVIQAPNSDYAVSAFASSLLWLLCLNPLALKDFDNVYGLMIREEEETVNIIYLI
jgi:hypothetical protein